MNDFIRDNNKLCIRLAAIDAYRPAPDPAQDCFIQLRGTNDEWRLSGVPFDLLDRLLNSPTRGSAP